MSLEMRKTGKLEDPGAELLDSATRLWAQYGRMVLIGLGVIAVVALGLWFTMRSRATSEEQAAGELAKANLLFWQGDYTRSLQSAKQVAEQWPGTASGLDAHRLAGDDLFWNGSFKDAIAEYRRYLAKQKNPLLVAAVQRSLAYALESDRQYAEAVTMYEGLVGRFDRESSAEFLMGAARCERALGRPQEAVKRLQRVVDEFGDTSYANRARMELGEISSAGR